MRIATQKEKFQYLGAPGLTESLDKVNLPFPVVLAWKPSYNIRQFSAHKLVTRHIELVYADLAKLDKHLINRAGIQLWGGCYEFRPVRGTETRDKPPFSAHSWGIAVDTDPVRNGLFMKAPKANLSHAEFDPIHDIWARYGFLNMGHVIGRDYMHHEASYELISNPSQFL